MTHLTTRAQTVVLSQGLKAFIRVDDRYSWAAVRCWNWVLTLPKDKAVYASSVLCEQLLNVVWFAYEYSVADVTSFVSAPTNSTWLFHMHWPSVCFSLQFPTYRVQCFIEVGQLAPFPRSKIIPLLHETRSHNYNLPRYCAEKSWAWISPFLLQYMDNCSSPLIKLQHPIRPMQNLKFSDPMRFYPFLLAAV